MHAYNSSTYYCCIRSQSYMTRAVFLSTEVLKVKGLWLQAASQFLKLTGEVRVGSRICKYTSQTFQCQHHSLLHDDVGVK